jgi:hypothetical protein
MESQVALPRHRCFVCSWSHCSLCHVTTVSCAHGVTGRSATSLLFRRLMYTLYNGLTWRFTLRFSQLFEPAARVFRALRGVRFKGSDVFPCGDNNGASGRGDPGGGSTLQVIIFSLESDELLFAHVSRARWWQEVTCINCSRTCSPPPPLVVSHLVTHVLHAWSYHTWSLTCSRLVAPHRTAPHRTAPHRTAPHRTAPHRTAPHRTAPCAVAGGEPRVCGVGHCCQARDSMERRCGRTAIR